MNDDRETPMDTATGILNAVVISLALWAVWIAIFVVVFFNLHV